MLTIIYTLLDFIMQVSILTIKQVLKTNIAEIYSYLCE